MQSKDTKKNHKGSQKPSDKELMDSGDAPIKLRSVTDELIRFAARGTDAICDQLSNDTAVNYKAISAAIRLCRAALDSIERDTQTELAREAIYHREELESIVALGVLEVAQ